MRLAAGTIALVGLLCAHRAAAYSFLSCSNYAVQTGACYGYPRKYVEWVQSASHAYDLQADVPSSSNQNLTAVDPLLQNRTLSTSALENAVASPQYPLAFAAYPGGYPMASAVPGQQLTLTWPRTADPDGDLVTSPTAWVYYSANATMNAGQNFNASVDPTLAEFQPGLLAALPFNAANGTNGTCPISNDSQKYDLSAHCNGAFTVPATLQPGIYTFLWYWRIEQPALYRLYPVLFEVLVQAPATVSATTGDGASVTSTAG